MTGKREIAIPCGDLNKISIPCKQCGGEIVANLSDIKRIRIRSEPEKYICPMCFNEFDFRIGSALEKYSDWFRLITESGHSATFRVLEPDD
jgi:hypothetical protein